MIDVSSQGNVQKSSSSKAAAFFDARSVLSVREHDKMARTPLADFFSIPRSEREQSKP
jgi:hypothetical protein